MRGIKFYNAIAYVLLLLYAVNFKWYSDYLFIGIIIFGYLTIDKEYYFVTDKTGLAIIFAFSTYFLIMLINGQLVNIRHDFMVFLIMPIFGYLLSNRLRCKEITGCEEELNRVVVGVVLMNGLYGALNYFARLQKFTATTWADRYSVDIWTGLPVAPTNQGANFTLAVSLVFWAILIFRNKKILGISIMTLSVVGLQCGFDTASRTIILIFAIVLSVNIILYIKLENVNKKIKTVFVVLLAVLLLYLAYVYDFANIRTTLLDSNLFQRMDQLEYEGYQEGRFIRWKIIFEQAPMYLMGNMPPIEWHAHNLWLDIYKDAGIFPFTGLFLYTVSVIIDLFKVIKIGSIDTKMKLMLISVVLGLIINFMVEPVLNAIPMIFCEFIIITGYIHVYINRLEEEMI